MLFDDARDDGEAEAGAAGAGGEIGLEDAGADVVGNALAVVDHLDDQGRGVLGAGDYVDTAAFRRGLDGVLDQVLGNLGELTRSPSSGRTSSAPRVVRRMFLVYSASISDRTAAEIAPARSIGSASALAADPAAGEKVFAKCKVCHAIGEEAKNKVGPQLNGIEGRKMASIADFKGYAADLKKMGEDGGVWTAANLASI